MLEGGPYVSGSVISMIMMILSIGSLTERQSICTKSEILSGHLARLVMTGSGRGISEPATNVGVGLGDNNISISLVEGDVERADGGGVQTM